jgi:hypothetical protein
LLQFDVSHLVCRRRWVVIIGLLAMPEQIPLTYGQIFNAHRLLVVSFTMPSSMICSLLTDLSRRRGVWVLRLSRPQALGEAEPQLHALLQRNHPVSYRHQDRRGCLQAKLLSAGITPLQTPPLSTTS